MSDNLTYFDTGALTLNFDQATILRDAAVPTTAANLTLPPPQGLARNGSVVRIDTSAQPAVLNVTSPDPNGVYAPGDEIEFVVTFSEMVAVTGTPFINIETGKVRLASRVSRSKQRRCGGGGVPRRSAICLLLRDDRDLSPSCPHRRVAR
jgi:hypothetical protein